MNKKTLVIAGLGVAGLAALVFLFRGALARGARELVNLNRLRTAMPKLPLSRAAEYIGPLTDAMDWAEINTPARISAFLAQIGHESGDLRYMEELASGDAYEGRKDLGNTQPGDGRRFKGRGPIQITGRANYRAFGQAVGMDFERNPELLATPEWGFRAAAWYWKTRDLNALADAGNFDQITYRINGGYKGKDDRDARYLVAQRALAA